MTNTTWGRKETIVWPYYRPLYTYGTILLCIVLTCLFVYFRFSFAAKPLQRFYAPLYVRTALIGSLRTTYRENHRVLFIAGHGLAPEPATNDTVMAGETRESVAAAIPLALSELATQKGYSVLLPAPVGMVTMAGCLELKKWADTAWIAASCALRNPGGLPSLMGKRSWS
jgi:hypothetical protein